MSTSRLTKDMLDIFEFRRKERLRESVFSDFEARQIEKQERMTRAKRLANAYAYMNEFEREHNKNTLEDWIVIGSVTFTGAVFIGHYIQNIIDWFY